MESDLIISIIVSSMGLMLCIAVVASLVLAIQDRRNRTRLVLAEGRAREAEEARHVEEEEIRKRTLTDVGRDLHDNIGQLLTVAQLGLDSVATDLGMDPRIENVMRTIETSIEEVRWLSKSMDTDRWRELPLGRLMEQECTRIARAGGVVVHFATSNTSADADVTRAPVITDERKVIFFRIFQEVMNNAMKHAHAECIEVALDIGSDVRLRIRDDGRGFDLGSLQGDASGPGSAAMYAGQGLKNLQKRAALLGYQCRLSSILGEGTTFTLTPSS